MQYLLLGAPRGSSREQLKCCRRRKKLRAGVLMGVGGSPVNMCVEAATLRLSCRQAVSEKTAQEPAIQDRSARRQ